jgi:YD repeat-containing protein
MLMKIGKARAGLIAPLLALLGFFFSAEVEAAVSYTYDLLGRVRTAVYDNGACVAYAYDADGNRTSQTNTNGGAPISSVWGSGVWGCFPWHL